MHTPHEHTTHTIQIKYSRVHLEKNQEENLSGNLFQSSLDLGPQQGPISLSVKSSTNLFLHLIDFNSNLSLSYSRVPDEFNKEKT